MSVYNRHPVALCTDGKLGILNTVVDKGPQNFLGLLLHLLFFTAYIRNDVSDYVVRGYSRIAGSRDCLHSAYLHGGNAEGLFDRGQGHCKKHGRAVGVGNYPSLPALVGQQRKVIWLY